MRYSSARVIAVSEIVNGNHEIQTPLHANAELLCSFENEILPCLKRHLYWTKIRQ